jgi:hypothetical protein
VAAPRPADQPARRQGGKAARRQGGLMIDEGQKVSYPDGVQAVDGTIHIIYDYNRTPDGFVLMAAFTEEDVRAGKPVTDKGRL